MLDWGDLRYFLVLAREGTTGRAARLLGCSQPTVVRRIAALEDATGLRLFERGANGFALTEAGTALLPVAEQAGKAMALVDGQIDELTGRAADRIRVTLLDQWEQLVLPAIQAHHGRWPGVEVQVTTSYRRFDLVADEADIALRAGVPFDQDAILERRMPDVGWGIYVARTLADDARPQSLEEVARLPMAGGDGNIGLLPALRWFESLAGPTGIAVRCNNFASVRAAILQGAIGMLPCVSGHADPALQPLFAPIPHLMVPVYLGVSRSAAKRPAVRALFEDLSAQVLANADLLGGRTAIVMHCC